MAFPRLQVPDRRVILVIAGTYKEFKDFCDDVEWEYNNIVPGGHERHFGKEYVFASDSCKIYGLVADDVIRVGTWRNRKDIKAIEALCLSRIRN